MIRPLFLALSSFALAAPAAALDCGAGYADLLETLPGRWTVENRVGTLTIGGKTEILPTGNTSTGVIERAGTGLSLSGGGAPGSYPLEFADESVIYLDRPNRTFRELAGTLFIDAPELVREPEIALLAGCAEDEVPPQFRASGVYNDPEGPVAFDLYLFAVDADLLYGVVTGALKSRGATARRITVWSR